MQSERLAVAAGLGMNSEEASRPQRVTVKGSEIAFAATGIVTNNLERHRAGPDKPGQNAYRFDDDYAEVRRRLVAAPADYRILSIHYGEEGRVRADAKQFADYRGLAAQKDGIDLIVGHHAHVVRGVEIAGNSLIFYGLGNFLHHGTADITGKGICRDYGSDGARAPEEGGRRQAQAARRRGHPRHRHALPPAAADRRSRAPRASTRSTISMPTSAASDGVAFTPQPNGTGLYCLAGRRQGRRHPSAPCARATGRRRRSPTTS